MKVPRASLCLRLSLVGMIVSAAGPALGSPVLPMTDKLMLWLDANDGLVHDSGAGTYTWADKATSYGDSVANNAVSSGGTPTIIPTPNGMDAVQFDAYADLFTVDATILSDDKDFAMFAVARANRDLNTALVGIRTANNYPYVQLDQSADGPPRFILRTENKKTADATGPTAMTGTWGIYGGFAQYDAAETLLRSTVYFNGTQQATATVDNVQAGKSVLTTSGTLSDQYIGGLGTNDLFWNGEIAEVLIYDRSLTALEFKQVNSYLDRKYGLDAGYSPLPLGQVNGFETPDLYEKKFTPIGTSIDWTDDTGGDGPFVHSSKKSHQTIVFDTDGVIGGEDLYGPNISIELDFLTEAAGSGMGIWFGGNEADRANKYWMFFQINEDGTQELVRFFTARNMATSNGGSADEADYQPDTALGLNEWMRLRLDIEQDASDVLSATLSVYDSPAATNLVFSQSHTFDTNTFLSGMSELGLSLFSMESGETVALDNVTIVPEPSALILLAAGLLACLLRRRR